MTNDTDVPTEEPEDAPPPLVSRPVDPEDLARDPGTGAPMPDAPRHVVEAAEEAPGHWFGLPDPAWTGEWPPPGWTVVGEWRADDTGQLVEWRHNPDYVPSPTARGWARPTDAVDDAVQRAAAGYGQDDEVPDLLAGAEVAVFVTPAGEPVTAVAPDGTPVVLAFTSEAHLTGAGRLTYEIHDVPDLAARLPEGHQLYLNASASVSMCVDPEALRRAIDRADHQTEPEPETETEPETELEPENDPEPEPENDPELDSGVSEVVPAAPRVDTTGSAPAPATGTSAPDTSPEPEPEPEPAAEPAHAPAPAPTPGTLTLADTAAAALMSPSSR
ncbi:type VII secretion system-associated protein [Streptomyces sp. NPDC003247]|uniref:type VII secretion system-associated protein n=1 Tax=Streptomyces sp. NPDC003247 TaxID=3364677 RepID=UPI0036CE85A8